jgi:chromosomal replication initiator protein
VRFAETKPAVPGRVSVQQVLKVAAEHFGLTVEALVSHSRKHSLVYPRQIAMFLAHAMTGRSLPFIAHHAGGWDHTTVLHAVRAVRSRIVDDCDADTAEAVHAISRKLTGGAHG